MAEEGRGGAGAGSRGPGRRGRGRAGRVLRSPVCFVGAGGPAEFVGILLLKLSKAV